MRSSSSASGVDLERACLTEQGQALVRRHQIGERQERLLEAEAIFAHAIDLDQATPDVGAGLERGGGAKVRFLGERIGIGPRVFGEA